MLDVQSVCLGHRENFLFKIPNKTLNILSFFFVACNNKLNTNWPIDSNQSIYFKKICLLKLLVHWAVPVCYLPLPVCVSVWIFGVEILYPNVTAGYPALSPI